MVAPIVKFLCGRGISLMAFMDDFTNQARCRCKVIFQIHVIALVFMCFGLVHYLDENIFGANQNTSPSWFLLGNFVEEYCLT